MKLELQEPFKSRWRKGYIRTSSIDGRTRVDLYNTEENRTTISFARYLISIHVGRELDEQEEVDHINNDKTDDRLDNLQLLSKEKHMLKTISTRAGRKYCSIKCPHCRSVFTRPHNYTMGCKNRGKLKFCSRSCGVSFSKRNENKWIYQDVEMLDLIAEEQVLTVFRK